MRQCTDRIEYGCEIAPQFVVLETHNTDAGSSKFTIALLIIFGIVECTVKFDGQSRGVAIEINDEARDYLLTAKMEPLEPIPSQVVPEPALLSRHLMAHLLRERELAGGNSLPLDDSCRKAAKWHST